MLSHLIWPNTDKIWRLLLQSISSEFWRLLFSFYSEFLIRLIFKRIIKMLPNVGQIFLTNSFQVKKRNFCFFTSNPECVNKGRRENVCSDNWHAFDLDLFRFLQKIPPSSWKMIFFFAAQVVPIIWLSFNQPFWF